jgi:hypothetical protein
MRMSHTSRDYIYVYFMGAVLIEGRLLLKLAPRECLTHMYIYFFSLNWTHNTNVCNLTGGNLYRKRKYGNKSFVVSLNFENLCLVHCQQFGMPDV